MIRVAIVEDEEAVREQLLGYVQRYTRQYGTTFEVRTFSDGVEILEGYRPVYDLILLDVEMKHLDGMETAQRIRALDSDVMIVFITNMAQYAIKGYAVGALDYVLKPVPYFAFSQQLQKAEEQLRRRTRHYLVVPVEGGLRRLDTSRIYYIESEGHRVRFYTEEGDFAAPGALKALEEKLGAHCFFMIADYVNAPQSSKVFNERIRDRICELSEKLAGAKDVHEFKEDMTSFYKDFGVGKLGLHKAFRVAHDEYGVQIVPITKIAHVHLDDLVGYELAKKKLIENTEAFVQGRKANNCLLFGDAGTGKSSSIKGILNEYYDQGLRIIEVYKHQFQDLNDVIAQVKNRNYRFIIYMDDLSFEEFEIEYKYLKAVIEGGLERKPENVLIYATSNRRHLIREKFSDKEERRDDLHTSDTVQEKLSLAYRFGLKIYFGSPSKKEFQNIVRVLADKHGITMSEEELFLKANQWELQYGGLSGRTAQQFIDHLLGQERKDV